MKTSGCATAAVGLAGVRGPHRHSDSWASGSAKAAPGAGVAWAACPAPELAFFLRFLLLPGPEAAGASALFPVDFAPSDWPLRPAFFCLGWATRHSSAGLLH